MRITLYNIGKRCKCHNGSNVSGKHWTYINMRVRKRYNRDNRETRPLFPRYARLLASPLADNWRGEWTRRRAIRYENILGGHSEYSYKRVSRAIIIRGHVSCRFAGGRTILDLFVTPGETTEAYTRTLVTNMQMRRAVVARVIETVSTREWLTVATVNIINSDTDCTSRNICS